MLCQGTCAIDVVVEEPAINVGKILVALSAQLLNSHASG